MGKMTKSFSGAGLAFSNGAVSPPSYDAEFKWTVPLPAGKVVTNWVKGVGDGDATADLPAGHGYTDGNFDVYWEAGGVDKVRYGVPGTIVTNALTLAGGTGDTFPASATAGIVVTKQVEFSPNIDGDNVKLFGVFFRCADADARGHVDFQDAGDATIEEFDLSEVDNTDAGMDHAYNTTSAVALLTGNVITQGFASNGSSTDAATLYVIAGIDSTP